MSYLISFGEADMAVVFIIFMGTIAYALNKNGYEDDDE